MTIVTKRATMADHAGRKIEIPAGTKLVGVMGGRGLAYGVANGSIVARITGDKFTASHYYAWVNPRDIDFGADKKKF